jgi:DNA-binding response OmpR family regulator
MILVVDDDYAIRKLLEVKLRSEGYDVVTAESGPEALDIAGKRRPDLIVLDNMMPGMSGERVAARVRATNGLQDVPILMLTAVRSDETVERAFAAGVDDYVTKPFNLSEIVWRVRALLRRTAPAPRPPADGE